MTGARTPTGDVRRPRDERWRAGKPGLRLLGLAVFTLLFLTAVIVRVGMLQTVDRANLQTKGEQQRIDKVNLTADRGVVFDRNGYELAMSVPMTSIWVDPRLVKDKVAAASSLADVLGLDAAVVLAKLSSTTEFEWIARQVDDDVATQVRAMKIDGVSFITEPKRFRPADDLARSLLGDTDVDGRGISGVEEAFDGQLTGTAGVLEAEIDGQGNTIPGGRKLYEPAEPGSDVVLTIDRNLQYAVEQLLIAEVAKLSAKGAMVVITRPNTGEVLAVANVRVPDSPAAATATTSSTTPAVGPAPVVSSADMAVVNVFEPGSVNKIITAAAALETGAVDPATVLQVPDTLILASDAVYHDSEVHRVQSWNLSDIITQSSNIGTIMVAQKMRPSVIDHYLRAFGLGQTTGVGLRNESSGLIPDLTHWTPSSMGSIPIGQGVAVTAIQMLEAMNVIANGGAYVTPTLVKATITPGGKRVPGAAAERRLVVSYNTASILSQMLARVVTEGTGKNAAIPGYTVAGKTGTARKPQDNGTYLDKDGNFHYVSSFAGFAPVDNPQISAIVVLDEPHLDGSAEAYFAGQTAAPIFAKVVAEALRDFQIPPAPLRIGG